MSEIRAGGEMSHMEKDDHIEVASQDSGVTSEPDSAIHKDGFNWTAAEEKRLVRKVSHVGFDSVEHHRGVDGLS